MTTLTRVVFLAVATMRLAHKCQCGSGSKGYLCQIASTGNGRCDDQFNMDGYSFDGGDCCPITCESSEFLCGTSEKVVFGHPMQEYVGYPHCDDPSQYLCDDGAPCWKQWADLRGDTRGSRAGTYVALSGNGQVIAVYEPGESDLGSQVRVFAHDGKARNQRGEPLSSNRRLQGPAKILECRIDDSAGDGLCCGGGDGHFKIFIKMKNCTKEGVFNIKLIVGLATSLRIFSNRLCRQRLRYQ